MDFPVLNVKMVSSEKVHANDYNPNKVATPEMKLLIQSIKEDGVTQPIVTFYDNDNDTYIIVDGFHRYSVLVNQFKCKEVPIVVIDKSIEGRMASTIRHNRARGKHNVELMSAFAKKLVLLGCADSYICKAVGFTAEELNRLKLNIGIAKVLSSKQYSKSWEMEEVDADENSD
jgi:ParB-like chromosome segregation protein Spo0J